ncbi:hypothetical protein HDU96_007523 [Phlyctochytrium bullatum]|nr:hypothetical protein HDU96_007523 [Phlyctochytrium bullatum]
MATHATRHEDIGARKIPVETVHTGGGGGGAGFPGGTPGATRNATEEHHEEHPEVVHRVGVAPTTTSGVPAVAPVPPASTKSGTKQQPIQRKQQHIGKQREGAEHEEGGGGERGGGQRPSEMMKWLGYAAAALVGLSSVWAVPRAWSWTKSMLGGQHHGHGQYQQPQQQYGQPGMPYAPQKQHYNMYGADRYPQAVAPSAWTGSIPFGESLAGFENLLNALMWPYYAGVQPSAPLGGAPHTPGRPAAAPVPGVPGHPSVATLPQLQDLGSHYSLKVLLPGLSSPDVVVKYSEGGSRLHVNAKTKGVDARTGMVAEAVEVAYVTVPRDAIVQRTEVNLDKGILNVMIPKQTDRHGDVHVPVSGPGKMSGAAQSMADFFAPQGSKQQQQQPSSQQGGGMYQSAKSAAERAGSDIYNLLPANVRDQGGIMSSIQSVLQRAYDVGKDNTQQAADRAGQMGGAAYDRAADYAGQSYDRASDYAGQTYGRARQAAGQAADYAGQTYDRAADYAGQAYDRARSAGEYAGNVGQEAYQQSTGYLGRVVEPVKQAGEVVYDRAKQAGEYVGQMGGAAYERARQFPGYVGHAAAEGGRQATEGMRQAGGYVASQVQQAGSAATEQAKEAGGYVGHMGSQATEGLKQAGSYVTEAPWKVGEAAYHVGERMADSIRSATSAIGSGASQTAHSISSYVAGGIHAAGERVAAATEAIKEMPANAWHAMRGGGGHHHHHHPAEGEAYQRETHYSYETVRPTHVAA